MEGWRLRWFIFITNTRWFKAFCRWQTLFIGKKCEVQSGGQTRGQTLLHVYLRYCFPHISGQRHLQHSHYSVNGASDAVEIIKHLTWKFIFPGLGLFLFLKKQRKGTKMKMIYLMSDNKKSIYLVLIHSLKILCICYWPNLPPLKATNTPEEVRARLAAGPFRLFLLPVVF